MQMPQNKSNLARTLYGIENIAQKTVQNHISNWFEQFKKIVEFKLNK